MVFPYKYEHKVEYLPASKIKKEMMERCNYFPVSLGERLGNRLDVLTRVFGLYLSSAGVRERFHYGGSVGLY